MSEQRSSKKEVSLTIKDPEGGEDLRVSITPNGCLYMVQGYRDICLLLSEARELRAWLMNQDLEERLTDETTPSLPPSKYPCPTCGQEVRCDTCDGLGWLAGAGCAIGKSCPDCTGDSK